MLWYLAEQKPEQMHLFMRVQQQNDLFKMWLIGSSRKIMLKVVKDEEYVK